MTRQVINYGSADNDGNGDSLRAAAIKIENNFGDLYSHANSTSNPHNVTALQVGAIPSGEKNAPGGVAGLDGTGKLNSSQKPAYALNEIVSGDLNFSLTPSTTGSLNLGSSSKVWNTLYVANVVISGNSVITNLNADRLDGEHGSFYQNASNILSGTIMDARLPSSMDNKIFTGNTVYSSLTNANRFYFTREGLAKESTSVGVDDGRTRFYTLNDETTAGITFHLIATDTETGGGANSSNGLMEVWTQSNATYLTVDGQTVWHAGNDGSGSGLDADLLDGQDSSYYTNASTLNSGTLPSTRMPALTGEVTSSAGSTNTSLAYQISGNKLFTGEVRTGSLIVNGTTTVGATITGASNFLNISNPGIGFANGFNFVRGTDSAGISVIEPSNDRVLYEFTIADNVEGNDAIQWRWTDWQGPNGLYIPFMINDRKLRFVGTESNFYSSINQPITNGFFTTGDPTATNNLNFLQYFNLVDKLKVAGSGSKTITSLQVADYTGTSGISMWIRAEDETTFRWGYGSYSSHYGNPVETSIPFSTSSITLSNGVRVTFNSGDATNADAWQFRVYRPATNTLASTSISGKLGVATSTPTETGISVRLGDTASEATRFGSHGVLFSSDTQISHNIYWTGSSWATFSIDRPSSTVRLGRSFEAEIEFGFASTGSNTLTYPYKFANTGVFTINSNTVWHAGNDGAGSGLDADLLDGQDATFYQNASNLLYGVVPNDRIVGQYNFSRVLLDDGTASAPSYSFTSDPDTGLTSTGGNVLNFVTGGATRANINTNGIYGQSSSSFYIFNRTSTSTVPTLVQHRGNQNTGIGGLAGHVSLIANSVEVVRVTDTDISLNAPISHNGLTPTAGTNIDQIATFALSMTLTDDWQDTTINANDLATGTYIVQVLVDDDSNGGTQNTEYYSGVMSWYSGDTDSLTTDEITLHRAGISPGANAIFLRVARTLTANVDDMVLQISGTNNDSSASTITFKFRRMI